MSKKKIDRVIDIVESWGRTYGREILTGLNGLLRDIQQMIDDADIGGRTEYIERQLNSGKDLLGNGSAHAENIGELLKQTLKNLDAARSMTMASMDSVKARADSCLYGVLSEIQVIESHAESAQQWIDRNARGEGAGGAWAKAFTDLNAGFSRYNERLGAARGAAESALAALGRL